MAEINNKIAEFFMTKLEWTWFIEYSALILIVAALLLAILIITITVAAVKGSKRKKKIKQLQARVNDGAAPSADEEQIYARAREDVREEVERQVREELQNDHAKTAEPVNEQQLREEIERQVRAELQSEYAQGENADYAPVADLSEIETLRDNITELNLAIGEREATIDELNRALADKDARIDELGDALDSANSAHETDSADFDGEISELKRTNKQLQNDINILKAENARLKTQARTVAAPAEKKPAPTVKPAAKSPVADTAKQNAALQNVTQSRKKPEPVKLDDDEDEVDNEFGDETSAVKVTLKFDKQKNNWVIYRSDTTRAYRRLATKQDAVMVAKDLARRLHAQLVVHKKDGKFQRI